MLCESRRYAGHLALSEIGPEGQKKLKAARVLCVGAGGLGAPVLTYLTASGVGTIGVVDFDTVSESNLGRQTLFTVDAIGRPKATTAIAHLRQLNPHVSFVPYMLAINSENAEGIVTDYDLVVDGSDNFETKHLLNAITRKLKKPLVSGSIFKTEGQISVFNLGDGPCYSCLYPDQDISSATAGCSEVGILSPLPGIVGSIQAAEAVKLIVGRGRALTGRLLVIDALNMDFKEFEFKTEKGCPVCTGMAHPQAMIMPESDARLISNLELARVLNSAKPPLVLDTREPAEFEKARIPGSHRYQEGADYSEREVVLYCSGGTRSREVNLPHAKILEGGFAAWRFLDLPVEKGALHIFGGLSISLETIRQKAPHAIVHGPIRRRDLPQIVTGEPGTIVIIDGVFHGEESCSLTELREAANAGWNLIGASSMGALRALEAAPLGMRGRGMVFRWMRLLKIEDDDEVAQVMDPESLLPLSLAMIDIRWIVGHARKSGALDRAAANEIIGLCKNKYYPERTWELVTRLIDERATKSVSLEGLRLPKQRDANNLIAKLGGAIR